MPIGGLRVLVVGINYVPETTGVAPYTAGLVEGLVERGHAVRLITSYPHYPAWQVDLNHPRESSPRPGLSVRRVRHYVPQKPSTWRRLLFEVAFGLRAASAAWNRYDVLVCVSPALFSSAVVMARASLSPRRPAIGLVLQDLYSQGVQETGQGGRISGSAMKVMESRVAKAADGVSVIHNRFRDTLAALGKSADDVLVIRNWAHVASRVEADPRAFRNRMGWKDDEVIVLHTGAMGHKQGLENVVEAAKLATETGSRVRFVLVGDGSRRETLERLAEGVAQLEIHNSFAVADYPVALRSADVLLVNERPGVQDMAVPSKLTSYFGAGRPVLAATDAGSATAEELSLSKAGMLIKPDDPTALLRAAAELAAGVDAPAMARNALEYRERVLSETAALDAYDDWVRVLHDRKRHKRTRGHG